MARTARPSAALARLAARAGRPRPRRSRRAIALIITLWVIVIMTVIAYSTLFEAGINVELTRHTRDRFYARMAARSGVGRAMVDLLNDLRYDRALATTEAPIDAKGDPWATHGENYTDVSLLPGRFTVRVTDEESLYPLRNPQLQSFQSLLEVLGMRREEDRNRTAGALIDYIDTDYVPRFEGAEAQTEDEAYGLLIGEERRLRRNTTVSYRNRNDRVQWVDELLDIYGIPPDLYYGSAWTGEADPRLSFRTPRYYRRLDYIPDNYRPGLRELVSPYNIGRININTARPEVLHALFTFGEGGYRAGEEAANDIISQRPEPGRTGRVDNTKAFRSAVELRDAGINPQPLSFATSGATLQVTSSHFRIVSTGTVRGVTYTIEAVVRRDWDAFQRDDSRGLNLAHRRTRSRDADQLIESPALRVLEWREY